MHATRHRCRSAIFDVIMIGSSWQSRHSAGGKKGFDHVGENGACLGEVECRDGRIHSVEVLAAAEELGVDRTDLVERLAHVAVIVEVLGNFGERVVRHVIDLWALIGRADRQIVLGTVAAIVGTMAAWPAAALVLLEQRAAQDACERWQRAQELLAARAQRRGGHVLHELRIPLITDPMILVVFDSWVKSFLSRDQEIPQLLRAQRGRRRRSPGIAILAPSSLETSRSNPRGWRSCQDLDDARSMSVRPKLF